MTDAREVTIGPCSATQIVGATRIPFATGTLRLRDSPTPPAKLVLSIDAATVALTAGSIVGTTGARTYVFTVPEADAGAVLEVTLPATADDAAHADSGAALALEELLAAHGFLATGLVADADDTARSVHEGAARVAGRVGAYVDWRVGRSMGVDTDVDERTKQRMQTAVHASQSAADATGRATAGVARAAEGAGEWVGHKVPQTGDASLPREAARQGAQATEVLAAGVAGAAGEVGGSMADGASRVADAEKGPQAKALVDDVRHVACNVGSAAADLVTGTSVAWHAGEAGMAAARADK